MAQIFTEPQRELWRKIKTIFFFGSETCDKKNFKTGRVYIDFQQQHITVHLVRRTYTVCLHHNFVLILNIYFHFSPVNHLDRIV